MMNDQHGAFKLIFEGIYRVYEFCHIDGRIFITSAKITIQRINDDQPGRAGNILNLFCRRNNKINIAIIQKLSRHI